MHNRVILYLLTVLALLGCKPSPPANVKHVSLKIFEIVECASGMVPMNVKESAEKYCLAANPVVDDTDIRGAEALHNESGGVRLALYTTSKAGDRLREATERITAEHLRRHDDGKLGVVVDGTLKDVPVVRGAISDAIVIDGAFSWDEAIQIVDSVRGRR